MCGVGSIFNMSMEPVAGLEAGLAAMNHLQAHRGPDGAGTWRHKSGFVGLAHRRLSVIDLETGAQPMENGHGKVISYNGEIYNYKELRSEIGPEIFHTASDTEVVLKAYEKWGAGCLERLRGMFAFAMWDERRHRLFLARDRFGVKPLYYTVIGDVLYAASEIKALLPFVERIETDPDGFRDYLAFQFCLAGKTLFKGIHELPPGHYLTASSSGIQVTRYWEVRFKPDFDHTGKYFSEKLRGLIEDSVRAHLVSDTPVGAYVSGGVDSGVISSLAADQAPEGFCGFNGRFPEGEEYDESRYARDLAGWKHFPIHVLDITCGDFVENIGKVIYHLDFPVAGPGSFPQYMVSRLASEHVKVVLGGQGGDEIFGGYTRYLVAYFEQCLKGAIDGTMKSGNFIVTYESIIPNLMSLRNYKPMLQQLWKDGIFTEDMDKRYLRLIDRAGSLKEEINWGALNGDYSPYDAFRKVFRAKNVGKESYFDCMTHFDFKTLLPALLQVEDRMSMAHGLESRVPFLDHSIVEFAATLPANVKFKNGELKHIFRKTMDYALPKSILSRKDKMGFPLPLTDWINGPMRGFVNDILGSKRARERELVNNGAVIKKIAEEPKFGRKIWGLLCLELWQTTFHDQEAKFKEALKTGVAVR
ncbi:MAG: asparagine synthase (glutamine-hydrolyzing) [Nitrospinae bacterium]|nr:asparagine synthase (glutamine-hydrolyzing) [Nitrospinota bacterium]